MIPEPPRAIPHELRDRYTLNGQVPVLDRYFNNAHGLYQRRTYTKAQIDEFLPQIARRRQFYYGQTDAWLYEALECHPIKGLSVAIMGSSQPLYEAVCTHFGGRPETIDYHPIASRIPGHTCLTVAEYESSSDMYDAAFSISSFEHDGLGRYGDPLCPEGDLKAMRTMLRKLRRGGLLYLAVPAGVDRLFWNAHRVYGRLRLPMLFSGWAIVDTFGFHPELLDDVSCRGHRQPVFVLAASGSGRDGDFEA